MRFRFYPWWSVAYFEEGGKFLKVCGFWGFRCRYLEGRFNFGCDRYFKSDDFDFELVRRHKFWGDEFFCEILLYWGRIPKIRVVGEIDVSGGDFLVVEDAKWLFELFQKNLRANYFFAYISKKDSEEMCRGDILLPGDDFFWDSHGGTKGENEQLYSNFIHILNFLNVNTQAWLVAYRIEYRENVQRRRDWDVIG